MIEVKNLVKHYGDVKAVNNIDFDIGFIKEYAENKGVLNLLTTKKDFYKINTLIPKKFKVFVVDVTHVLSEKVDLTQFFH